MLHLQINVTGETVAGLYAGVMEAAALIKDGEAEAEVTAENYMTDFEIKKVPSLEVQK